MAEETKNPETVFAVVEPPLEQLVVPQAEKVVESHKELVNPSPPEDDKAAVKVEAEAEAEAGPDKITQSVSFKEETNVAGELPESQRKALDELKKLIQDALAKREFSAPLPPPVTAPPLPAKEEEKKEEVVAEKKVEDDEQTPPAAPTTEGEKAGEEVAPPPPSTGTAASSEKEEAAVAAEEPPKVAEEPVKAEEALPVTEEVKKEDEEKALEDIKETIVEVVAVTSSETPAAADETQPKEVAVEAEAGTVTETETAPVSDPVEPEEVSIWGIPLLADERTDVILLKFLRARDFKVKDAFTMIRNTVRWRKEFGVDELLVEDLGKDYEKVLFTHGYDKEGRIVCYNVFGEFQNKELYQNTFSDAEKRKKFLKWLIQFLEKIIRDLDFNPKGINSIVLVNDLKNSPGYGKRDVSKIIDKFLVILQDNYPEFVAKQLCINTSWWYVAYYWIYLTVFTPRSKSKFVFASPSKTPETLFKYIAPEHVPIQYGGHSKIGDTEFSPADPVTEVIIKPGSKHPIEFAFSEAAVLVWELRVIGWDVNYGAEFSPAKEGGYTLNISKPKKVPSSTDEPVISDTFKVTEAGKVIITIDNQSSKKKKLLYRSKVKVSSE